MRETIQAILQRKSIAHIYIRKPLIWNQWGQRPSWTNGARISYPIRINWNKIHCSYIRASPWIKMFKVLLPNRNRKKRPSYRRRGPPMFLVKASLERGLFYRSSLGASLRQEGPLWGKRKRNIMKISARFIFKNSEKRGEGKSLERDQVNLYLKTTFYSWIPLDWVCNLQLALQGNSILFLWQPVVKSTNRRLNSN